MTRPEDAPTSGSAAAQGYVFAPWRAWLIAGIADHLTTIALEHVPTGARPGRPEYQVFVPDLDLEQSVAERALGRPVTLVDFRLLVVRIPYTEPVG